MAKLLSRNNYSGYEVENKYKTDILWQYQLLHERVSEWELLTQQCTTIYAKGVDAFCYLL